jgi:hypothetical protein
LEEITETSGLDTAATIPRHGADTKQFAKDEAVGEGREK